MVIAFDRRTNLRNLLGTEAHLAVFSTGITNRKNPKRMPLATSAFLTSRGVMNRALEQRATEDANRWGKLGCQFFPFADGLFSCHQ